MPTNARALSVLVVEDDDDTRDILTRLVRAEGCDVRAASTLEQARALISESRPDVVLTDLLLADGKGTEVLVQMQHDPGTEVIIVTGNASVDSDVEALRLGAHDYLTKPIDVPRLKQLLVGLRRTQRLTAEVGRLKGELRRLGRFGPLVGSSPAMQQVYDLIERVAPTDATVLLVGESGTGKELVAQAISKHSRRADAPFVAINCGAIAASLVESALFGHERGSFTGADRRHAGCFEQANGGTLFLDEVTEMSADLQVRLLRVLETSVVQRIGGHETIPVNVRVIAATNRSPEQAVQDGKLREDLYYRLRVFPIRLPALRERAGDIETLVRSFIEELNAEAGVEKRVTDEAMEVLRRHTWPGNVRELRNVVKQCFIMSDDAITADLLPSDLGSRQARDGAVITVGVGTPLEDVERRLILATIDQLGGDKREAAKRLGIGLRTLYNRLAAYNGTAASAADDVGDGESAEAQ